jgi:hypothetical protein
MARPPSQKTTPWHPHLHLATPWFVSVHRDTQVCNLLYMYELLNNWLKRKTAVSKRKGRQWWCFDWEVNFRKKLGEKLNITVMPKLSNILLLEVKALKPKSQEMRFDHCPNMPSKKGWKAEKEDFINLVINWGAQIKESVTPKSIFKEFIGTLRFYRKGRQRRE